MEPRWWTDSQHEIHEILDDFTSILEHNLAKPVQIFFRSNPFLLRSRSETNVRRVAVSIVSTHLTKSAQTVFGRKIEEIAIAICKHAKGGRKSGITGIDLEYDVHQTRFLVSIKSGENWGNSSQRKALVRNFNSARQVLGQNKAISVRCVEGVCSGRSHDIDLGTHRKVVGADFWYGISGWKGSMQKVMEIIGAHANNGLMEVQNNAADEIVTFLRAHGVVDKNSSVNWNRLLAVITEQKEPKKLSIEKSI